MNRLDVVRPRTFVPVVQRPVARMAYPYQFDQLNRAIRAGEHTGIIPVRRIVRAGPGAIIGESLPLRESAKRKGRYVSSPRRICFMNQQNTGSDRIRQILQQMDRSIDTARQRRLGHPEGTGSSRMMTPERTYQPQESSSNGMIQPDQTSQHASPPRLRARPKANPTPFPSPAPAARPE